MTPRLSINAAILIFLSLTFGQLPVDHSPYETHSVNIDLPEEGGYYMELNLSADTSWEEENNESAVLTIFINDEYSHDIVICNGAENHIYQQMLGTLDSGMHTIDFYFDYDKSSPLASNIHIEETEVLNGDNADIDIDAFSYSPILYGRNIFSWNESSHTDIPL